MLVKIIIQFRICLKKNIIKQVKINKKNIRIKYIVARTVSRL